MPGGKRWTRRTRRMSVEEILDELRYYGDGTFPRTALERAVAKKEAITPELLKILEDAAQDVEGLPVDYMAHLYAMFLLAQFREERAYPLLVDFFSTPGEVVMDLCGEIVTEDLGRILASVSGGDPGPMKSLVENEEANEFVRSAALDGLVSLVVCGEMSRQEVMDYLHQLFQMDIPREEDIVWSSLVNVAMDLYPEGEVYEDIKQAYADDMINTSLVDLDDVNWALSRGKEERLEETQEHPHYQLVEDVISEMEWWASFDGYR